MRVPASGRHYRTTHALLRQAMSGGRERVAAAVLWRAADDRNTVVPVAGRRPGNATEDHEGAGQRPALPEHHALLRQAMPGGRERAAAAVPWRAAEDRNTVVPAAGRQPGNATEDHEGAGQRPALPEYHALLRQAMPGGRERVAAAVLRRAADDQNTVVPAAGRQPGNATEDHEVAGQRPALPIAKVYGPGGKRTSKRAPPSSLERPTASSPR